MSMRKTSRRTNTKPVQAKAERRSSTRRMGERMEQFEVKVKANAVSMKKFLHGGK